MIHYHGGPITPMSVAVSAWTRRHAFVSFERPDQIALAAEVCQSFALDNGAFSAWRTGQPLDVAGYVRWVDEWRRHPGFDWCLIPDVIDGDEQANDAMCARFRNEGGDLLNSVPVWHLHESIDRLVRLCHTYPRVALGSSGVYKDPGSRTWWPRMAEAMDAICDDEGRPPCKLHGLRMLSPRIFERLPLASADSTNAARNHVRAKRMHSLTDQMQALVLIDRIEQTNSAPAWVRDGQQSMELIG